MAEFAPAVTAGFAPLPFPAPHVHVEPMTLHILKLCVGCDSLDDLAAWQAERRRLAPATPLRHVTRMWPKRGAEILDGGSLYWVIKGQIAARQRITALEPVEGEDGVRRCALVLDPQLVRTDPAPRRPFQGWRYLAPGDAPRDLPEAREGEEELPEELAKALAALGLR